VALLTPSFQISGLQNCERIHFCHSKPPSLWLFVMQSQEMDAGGTVYN
jgi:hypothetical protein